MLVAPTTPDVRKGGMPRKPAGEVKVRTIDNRRCIDKKRRMEFLAAGKALPPELLNIEEASGIHGRPRLSDEAIELKKHASAQRMRKSRAKRAAADVATGAEAARAMVQRAACGDEGSSCDNTSIANRVTLLMLGLVEEPCELTLGLAKESCEFMLGSVKELACGAPQPEKADAEAAAAAAAAPAAAAAAEAAEAAAEAEEVEAAAAEKEAAEVVAAEAAAEENASAAESERQEAEREAAKAAAVAAEAAAVAEAAEAAKAVVAEAAAVAAAAAVAEAAVVAAEAAAATEAEAVAKAAAVAAEAAAVAEAAAAEAEAHAERVAAERQGKMLKLKRQLDARNASDGLIADGPEAIRLRAFARDDECVECAICLGTCDSGDSDDSGASDLRRMRCCGAVMRARCLREWLQRKGQSVRIWYEDGVQGVQHVRHGRKLWTTMNTHRCPVCCHAVESVRRASSLAGGLP